ncbi:MAG: hemerythrin domain-containing protein [Ectothiorhodospiraceae bacterium]
MDELLKQLHVEHGEIAEVLAVIEDELERLAAGEPPDFDVLRDAVYYMTEFPDLFHHTKEDLLYRRMAKRRRRVRDAVHELEHQHRSLRSEGMGFRETVEDAAEDAMVERNAIVEQGRAYVAMQRDHMRTEEAHILPLAEEVLSEEDWQDLRKMLPGDGPRGLRGITRERFRSLYAQLERTR